MRPRLTPIVATIAAVLVAGAHIVIGILLKIKATGVFFQTADQVSIGALGVVIGGCLLLLTRPRLRIGAAGVSVRNLFTYRLVPWSEVVDISFPVGARWARVDLPDDEYVPLLAIQAVDRERAVDAMDAARALMARYRGLTGPAAPSPPPSAGRRAAPPPR